MAPGEPGSHGDAVTTGMVQVTGTAQRQSWLAGRMPTPESLPDGTLCIPVPIPDSPLRYTMCYVVPGDEGVLMIDPGWESELGWTALRNGLRHFGIGLTEVTGVVVTHVHADHHGLTARVVAGSGAWVGMHAAERATLSVTADPDSRIDDDRLWIGRLGVPEPVRSEIALSSATIGHYSGMAAPTHLVADGDLLPLTGRRIRAVWTPGHTAGHLCFHDEDHDRLFTGDHLLPRISPNISVHADGENHPLTAYLGSLRRIASFDSAEACPAHEWRFRGVAARAGALLDHHRLRCDEILAALSDGGRTAWEVTGELTWSRGWPAVTGMMRRAALAETVAHLVYLADAGELAIDRPTTGPLFYRVLEQS